MNKDTLISDYKWFKIVYKPEQIGNEHCRINLWSKTIFVYDLFLKQKEVIQYSLLEHEIWHFIYNKFTPEDKILWEKASYADLEFIKLIQLLFSFPMLKNKYISEYAKKSCQEDFCENLKTNYLFENVKKKLLFETIEI